MDRRSKVELFEQIRREYRHGTGTIKGVAKKLKVHRRMVRQALASAVPPERKSPERKRPKLDRVAEYIEKILEADLTAPRKQRHTAHRVWQRLREEKPDCPIAEATVRRFVQQCKEALGLKAREVFIPQTYEAGSEAQADWYEATVRLDGEPCVLQIFSMRSMASGGAFHVAYRHATQQAFLEAHELAFHYFGGVFRLLRYDNLSSAVKKIVRGRQRVETDRLIAFRSHWGFQTDFCNPARGNEKGGVEGELGYFRRNCLVPVPDCKDLDELNEKLLASCRAYEHRQIQGKPLEVGAAMAAEREHLLPLAEEGFDLAEVSFPEVDGKGCVKVRTNWYSTPLKPGARPRVKLLAAHVEIWFERECVARHERCYGRYEPVLNLEHYLEVLSKKPGALAGSTALAQYRERGLWTGSFDRLWNELRARRGKQDGTREMIELLGASKRHGWERLRRSVEKAMALGCADAAAIRHMLDAGVLEPREAIAMPVGALSCYDRAMPGVAHYDALLGAGA